MMMRQQSQLKRQERRETRKQMTPRHTKTEIDIQKPKDNINVGRLQSLMVMPSEMSEDSVSENGSTKTKKQMKEENNKEKEEE